MDEEQICKRDRASEQGRLPLKVVAYVVIGIGVLCIVASGASGDLGAVGLTMVVGAGLGLVANLGAEGNPNHPVTGGGATASPQEHGVRPQPDAEGQLREAALPPHPSHVDSSSGEQGEGEPDDGSVCVALVDRKDAVRVALMRVTDSGIVLVPLKTIDPGGGFDRMCTGAIVLALAAVFALQITRGLPGGWFVYFAVAVLVQVPLLLYHPFLKREKARAAQQKLGDMESVPVPPDAQTITISREALSKGALAPSGEQLTVEGTVIVSTKPFDQRVATLVSGTAGGASDPPCSS